MPDYGDSDQMNGDNNNDDHYDQLHWHGSDDD